MGTSTPGSGLLAWYENLFYIYFSLAHFSQVNEYMAYQLLTNYNNSTDIKGFVDDYDFYIFPIVNPDGKRGIL